MADNTEEDNNTNTNSPNTVPAQQKKRKATRKVAKQRTIPPDSVTDKAKWYFYKKKNYANLVQREDGALLVLDPKTLDPQTPAKTFLRKKGQADALVAVYNEELRASATAHMTTLEEARREATDAAGKAFREVEQEMLATVAEWRLQANPSDRAVAAKRVGALQAQLVALDEARRNAAYPQRFVRNEKLSYMALDYTLHKESAVPYAVYVTKHLQSSAADRLIEVGTA